MIHSLRPPVARRGVVLGQLSAKPEVAKTASLPSWLFLAGLGVYGVLTYSVAQRYRELGLRLALGAQRANIYWLVLRDGLSPVAIGAAAGIAVAFGSARVMRSLLFEVSPYDPMLSAGALGVLLAVGTIACLLPARRAAAVEPMGALRME